MFGKEKRCLPVAISFWKPTTLVVLEPCGSFKKAKQPNVNETTICFMSFRAFLKAPCSLSRSTCTTPWQRPPRTTKPETSSTQRPPACRVGSRQDLTSNGIGMLGWESELWLDLAKGGWVAGWVDGRDSIQLILKIRPFHGFGRY